MVGRIEQKSSIVFSSYSIGTPIFTNKVGSGLVLALQDTPGSFNFSYQ